MMKRPFEILKKDSPQYHLYRHQWYTMHNVKKNMIGLNTGGSGDGKSWASIIYAYMVDPRFTIDKIVHSDTQFYNALSEVKRVGEFIIWDEAGVGIPAKEWYRISNKAIGKTLQVFRGSSRIGLLFTTQDMSFIDSQSRKLLNYFFMMSERNTPDQSKMYVRKIMVNRAIGKMYMPYPRIRINGHNARLKYVTYDAKDIAKLKDLNSMLRDYDKESKHWKRKLVKKQQTISEQYLIDQEEKHKKKVMTKGELLEQHVKEIVKDTSKYLTDTGKFDTDLIRVHRGLGTNDANTVKKMLLKEFSA